MSERLVRAVSALLRPLTPQQRQEPQGHTRLSALAESVFNFLPRPEHCACRPRETRNPPARVINPDIWEESDRVCF